MIGNSTEVGRALASRCILPRRGKPLLAGNPRLQWEANLVASLSHRMLSLLAMGVFWYKFVLSLRAPGLAQIKWNQLRAVLIDSPKVLDFWLNKPYPYSRYWTGTNLQCRITQLHLQRLPASTENANMVYESCMGSLQTRGVGSPTPGGVSKNKHCDIRLTLISSSLWYVKINML